MQNKTVIQKIIRRGRNFLTNQTSKEMLSREKLQMYWREPWKWDDNNNAEDYLASSVQERTKFLVSLFKDIPKSARILDIGCNSGRNLYGLWRVGYTNLTGIEISSHAVELLHKTYNMTVPIFNVPVEDIISNLGEFDVVYTMAVLEHLPKESDWVIREIARIGKRIITIEDEVHVDRRHRARSYKEVFEGFGMKQVMEINCANINDIFDSAFYARVFVK